MLPQQPSRLPSPLSLPLPPLPLSRAKTKPKQLRLIDPIVGWEDHSPRESEGVRVATPERGDVVVVTCCVEVVDPGTVSRHQKASVELVWLHVGSADARQGPGVLFFVPLRKCPLT